MEDNKFRFTGIDVVKSDDKIIISMEDDTRSLELIEVRSGKPDEPLTREEMKVIRKYVGKINWLAANVRPDLAIDSLELAKKQKKATLKDLRSINRIIKKVYEKDNKVVFRKIGND